MQNSYFLGYLDMSSQKPRIALTVDDDLNKLLEDLSVLMKKPKSTLITDILVDITLCLPTLETPYSLQNKKKDIKPVLARMTAKANIGTAEMNNDMLKQFDWVEKQDD